MNSWCKRDYPTVMTFSFQRYVLINYSQFDCITVSNFLKFSFVQVISIFFYVRLTLVSMELVTITVLLLLAAVELAFYALHEAILFWCHIYFFRLLVIASQFVSSNFYLTLKHLSCTQFLFTGLQHCFLLVLNLCCFFRLNWPASN